MPYINPARREHLEGIVSEPDKGVNEMSGPGELNYLVTRLVGQYLDQHGSGYQTVNDVVGALEGAKLEFYRRVASPYEDGKIAQNGDVYDGYFAS